MKNATQAHSPPRAARSATRKSRSPNGNAKRRAHVLFPRAEFLTRNERSALNAYKNYLIRNLPGQIERIILYGSKARGDAQPDSDLDVLVVVNGEMPNPFQHREGIWHKVVSPDLDLSIQYGVFLSPVVRHVDEIQEWSPFLADIRRDGVELWKRPGLREPILPKGGWEALPMHKAQEVEARLAIAEDKLRAARKLFEEAFYNDTISKAYYAMFYASKALVLQLGLDLHKHKGVISLYGQRIAHIGLTDPKYGHVLSRYLDLRLDADYEVAFRATREEAEEAIRAAEDFLAEARRTLTRLREQENTSGSNNPG